MKYYVNLNASQKGNGSRECPFQKIQEAASCAVPGDEVIVAPGIYREAVNPVNSGNEDARITYRSEVEKAAIITGAEQVKNWNIMKVMYGWQEFPMRYSEIITLIQH